MHLRRTSGRFLIVLALLVGTLASVGSPANAAEVGCARGNANPVNTYVCPVVSTYSTYYQAYPWHFVAFSNNAQAQIHVQALVRRTGTGFFLENLWVDYTRGPLRYAYVSVEGVDGDGRSKNGSWNYSGLYSPDWADNCRTCANITRYPRLSPSAPVWFAFGRNHAAYLTFKLALTETPNTGAYPGAGTPIVSPLNVIFRQP
jgi:hypothetical protein